MKEQEKYWANIRAKNSQVVRETYVVFSQKVEVENGEADQVNNVAELAAHLPGWLLGVGLGVEVVSATMQPVEVPININLLEAPELEHGMVLQVVVL